MKYKIKLAGLDCANCANKIETKVLKLKEVDDASLNFNTSTLYMETKADFDDVFEKVKKIVNDLEPDVVVSVLNGNEKMHYHEHDHKCSCGHEHHHEHDHECSCGHEHHHEHDHKCSCGHEHHHEHDHECSCGHEHHHEHGKSCDINIESQPYVELANAVKFNILNLDCANCAMKVESHINQLDYIAHASINFGAGKLQVQLEKKMGVDELLTKLQKVIDNVEPGVVIELINHEKNEEKPKLFEFKKNIPLVVGTILCIIAALNFIPAITPFLFMIAYILIGGKVVLKAIRNISHGEIFDENFLMVVATIGAFIIGEYFEAVAVMLFYNIGELFQSYAVNRSRKSISSLMNIRADYANIIKNGKELKMNPEEVEIGDIMVVRPGERVALDGIIVEGQTSLDTSALTGESVPRKAKEEDEILSGVINMSGVIKVKITTNSSESTVSRILELVENATNKKAPIERFITKFSKVYTPIVCLLALVVAIIPPFVFNQSFNVWAYRALTFLVVSCPCALVISVPLALFAGIGGASKYGALIKGGSDLERLKDLDVVVLDKTGTLTKGEFNVVKVEGIHRDEILRLAAFGEVYSSHPIAKSIVKKYNQEIDKNVIENYQEIAGQGIKVTIENKEVLLGNTKLMTEHQIQYQEVDEIGTIVHVASNQQYLGYIVIADEIKETSFKGLQELKSLGVKRIVMLTGDDLKVAKNVASQLGINEFYTNLLPQDKVTKVEELLKENHKQLAFVGDGINDAPVLARSDIGVAMGGIGSDVAIEAADIVLMNDDLNTLATALKVSRKTGRVLNQNISFSLFIKIGVLILTTFGLSNMWMGVFADVGVTFIAILNSMRTMKVEE